MTVHRTALASAIIAVCAGYGICNNAQAQLVPAAPALPAQAASGAAVESLATAPTTYIAPSLAVLAVSTSNANFGNGLTQRSDTILNIVPRLVVQSNHAHWHLRGDFSLSGLYYVRGTLTNTILPSGSLNLGAELVDHFLFLDAGVQSQQNVINPYVGQFNGPSSNTFTTTQYRISPYIDRLINPDLRFIARSDDTWTKVNNTPANTGIYGGRYTVQTVSLDQRPLPLGYTLLARQGETIYDNLPYSSLKDSSFRAIGNYAVSDRLVLGLIGGYEKVDAFLAHESKPIYGVRGAWQPNAFGRVDATVEHRYFGTGWNLQALGGSPLLNLSLNWTRNPTTYLASLFNGGAPGANITTMLDGMLLSQYPDPVARAQAVQNLLNSSGLPAGLSTANNFFTASATLQNALSLTALMLRERNSYALSLFRTKAEDLFLPGQTLLQAVQTLSNDNIQTGIALNYGHQLTPLDNVNVTVLRANNSGFGINQGVSSKQTSFIAQYDHQFSTRTTGLIGLRRQLLKSTAVANSNESAIFAGVIHRF
jgi:uncharacterized protein (PEP-CTERM system associated)